VTDKKSIIEPDEHEAKIGSKKWTGIITELETRCKNANIECEVETDKDFDETFATIKLPEGREKRSLNFGAIKDIRKFLSIPFEKYIFLSGYSAICSYTDREIEALISPLRSLSLRAIFVSLFGRVKLGQSLVKLDKKIILSPPQDITGPEISIGFASDKLNILTQVYDERLSFKLRRIEVSQHDQALSILEKISNSLFFQIDLLNNVPLCLQRESRGLKEARRLSVARDVSKDLQYPADEYDKAPMSLYWYAKSAENMPLLQFLAFYQVIEFYFPVYYEVEARRKIRAILKDPTFRNERDADLARILSSIQPNRSGGLGNELSQLKASIMECVDADALRSLLTSDEAMTIFFSSKAKGLTDHKLPISNLNIDLRNDSAERMYDIRCKIVHTKSNTIDGETELLLPFSEEAEQLYYDIRLIEFIARKIIISASTPIKM
jgi:hypothetical protein